MAAISITPLYMKDVTLTIGTDSYEKHVSGVTLTPSTATATWKGLSPSSTFTDASQATWMLDLTYAQDWDTTNSLSKYLFANQGATKTITFKPKSANTPTVTVSVIIIAGSIGGNIDSYAESTVSLPVQGQPTLA